MVIEADPPSVLVRGHVEPRAARVMAKGWIQAVVLVGVFGFTVLGFMAARTYQADPPIPDRVLTMRPEAMFLAGYAFSLALVAVGLEWLGRRSTDPWTSRTLAASGPPTQQIAQRSSDEGPDWPHSDVPAFHLGLAAVALTAAFVITALSTVRYVGATELVVHSALLVVISVRIRHVIIETRSPTRPLQGQSTPTALSEPGPHVVGQMRPSGAELEQDV